MSFYFYSNKSQQQFSDLTVLSEKTHFQKLNLRYKTFLKMKNKFSFKTRKNVFQNETLIIVNCKEFFVQNEIISHRERKRLLSLKTKIRVF